MRNSFENFEIRSEDRNKNYEIILESEKSLEIPNPKDFTEIYSSEEIENDLDYLAKIKKKIEQGDNSLGSFEREIIKENKRRGECLEVIVADQGDSGNWFGEYAMVTKTSEFDDIRNGVDMVVEFDKEEPERIALAVDASTASEIKVIEDKIKRNIAKLKDNVHLQEVKYFKSQISNEKGEYYKGSIRDLIPVVIGADKHNVDNLFQTFSELKFLEKDKTEGAKIRRRELRYELSRNPLQTLFVEEIKIQLETYKKVSENKKVIDECFSLLKIIDEVIEMKAEENIYFNESVLNDKTYNNIKEVCEGLK